MSDHEGDPLDEVISEFRRMPVPAPPDPSDVLSRLTPALDGDGRSPSAVLPLLWSFLMRPTVRYLSATALLLGALTWLVLGPSGSVALAEVIQATVQHKHVRYQLRETITHKTNVVTDQTRTVYADLVAPRLRFELRGRTLDDVLEYESVMVQDNQKDRFLKLISHVQVVDEAHADAKQKQVIRLVKERGLAKRQAFLYRLTREDGQPFNLDDLIKGRPLLESLRELQDHKGTTSARARLDGREMLNYRLQERDTTTSLWVDPRTKLPVRIESVTDHPTRDVSKVVAIYSGFEWDPNVADPERLFSTEPPVGYAVEDHTNALGAGSTTARDKSPDSPESTAVLKRLEEKVPMQFPNEIPLEQVLEYIRAATRGPSGTGIPCAFDDDGMRRAGQSRTSLVTIDVQDEPLKTSLRTLLEPLGLTYEVRRGVVTITSGAAGSRKRP
jgi:hypothetical protein